MCNTGCCSLCNLKLVKQCKAQTFYRVSQAFAFHGDVGFKETFQQNFLRIKQKPYDHMHNCAGLLMLRDVPFNFVYKLNL